MNSSSSKTTRTSKFENYIDIEFLDNKYKIFDEEYKFLNSCCRKEISRGIKTKVFLIMYNFYLSEDIIKPFINNLIFNKIEYSINNNIYYCQKNEIDNINNEEYQRTYVYISILDGIYFKSSDFIIKEHKPIIRIIDKRDIGRVKLFMCSGTYFKEDIQEMIQCMIQ